MQLPAVCLRTMHPLMVSVFLLAVSLSCVHASRITFINRTGYDTRLWCSMQNETVGGAEGLLLQPLDVFDWLNSAGKEERGYDCTAIKRGKKALWSSSIGGNATEVVWTLNPGDVRSNSGGIFYWFD